MIDIHNHILYGIDDGPAFLEESLKLGQQFVASGYTKLIATPHYYDGRYISNRKHNEQVLVNFQKALQENDIPLEIRLGNEVFFSENVISNLKHGKISPLGMSNFLLLEFSFSNEPTGLEQLIYELQLEGFIPIIAHPERYKFVQTNPDWLIPYIKMGAYTQCNISSITDEKSPEFFTTRELLEKGLIYLFASDAHRPNWRNAELIEGQSKIKALVGEERFHALFHMNPTHIWENNPLEPVAKLESQKKSIINWFKRRK